MSYKVGDKIIFNKNYKLMEHGNDYTIENSRGWVENWLVGRIATITRIETCWYYIDIPGTHGYDEALFSKIELVEI